MFKLKISQNEALRNGDLSLRGQVVDVVSTKRAISSNKISSQWLYTCVTKSGRTLTLQRAGDLELIDTTPSNTKRVQQGKQPLGAEALNMIRGGVA